MSDRNGTPVTRDAKTDGELRLPYLDGLGNLTFVSGGGRVHVEVPVRPEDVDPALKHPDTGLEPMTDGPLSLFVLSYHRTLCGKVGFGTPGGNDGWQRLSSFADERLCAACHRAMGENAVLIFEQNLLPHAAEQEPDW